MSTNIQDIIARAQAAANPQVPAVDLGTPVANAQVPTPQQAYVTQAAVPSGAGATSADPVEQDMRNLAPLQLIQKYGPEMGQQMIIRRNVAASQVSNDMTVPRDWGQAAADTVTDIGMGVANMVGGTAALGAGLFSADAGSAISNKMTELNEFAQSTQSPSLNANRRLINAETAMNARDSKQQMERDIQSGESEASAGIKRVLRDLGNDFITNATNGVGLGPLVAQGIGSVLPVGAVAGAAGVVSRSALGAGVRTGALTTAEAQAILNLGSNVGTAATIGVMEAGGAYQQSVEQVQGMTHEQLMIGSEQYRALIAEGIEPNEAKTLVANKAGLASAGITAPFAIALGKTVARFEADPLARVGAATATRQVGIQTGEEAAQGGVAQYAGNIAVQNIADTNQDLTDGVGNQLATGALVGAGMAGILQAPGVAAQTLTPVVNSVRNAAKQAADMLPKTGPAATTVTPTTSMAVVQEQAKSVAEAMPDMAARMEAEIQATQDTPEVKAEKSAALQSLVQAFTYTPDHFAAAQQATNGMLDPQLGEKLQGTTTLPEAIKAAGEHLLSGLGDAEGKGTAIYLNTLMDMAQQMADTPEGNELVNAAQSATASPDAKAFVDDMIQVMTNLDNSKEFQTFIQKATQTFEASPAPAQATAETAPEIAARASFAPHTLQHDVVTQALEMHGRGEIELSPYQVMRLEAAAALTEAMASVQDMDDPIATVTRQVAINMQKDDNQKYPSIAEHHSDVTKALAKGDTKAAIKSMMALRNLARTFNNKVAAFNESAVSGQPVNYRNWSPALGKWLTSEKGLIYRKGKENSVVLANRIANEAKLAVGVYNNLREAFPELAQVKNIVEVPLTELANIPKTVVPAKKKQAAPTPQPAVVEEAPVVKAEEPKPAPAPEPVVEEVVQEEAVAAEVVVEETAEPEAVEEPTEQQTVSALARAKNLLKTAAGDNLIDRLFRPASNPSRLAQVQDRVFDSVISALGSKAKFEKFVGTETKFSEAQLKTAREYFNSYGATILDNVQDRVKELLDTKLTFSAAKGLTQAEVFARIQEGDTTFPGPETWKDGSGAYASFVAVTRDAQGNAQGQLDPYFAEVGSLAAANWMLTANGRGSYKLSEDQVANIAGISVGDVSDQLRDLVSLGQGHIDVIRGIADQIERYMSIQMKDDAPVFRAQGLSTALATLMFSSMVQDDTIGFFFDRVEIKVDNQGGIISSSLDTGAQTKNAGKVYRTIHRYVPKRADESVVPKDVSIASVLDTVAAVEPDNTLYFDPEQIAVSDTQLRSSVPLSAKDKQAQDAQQKMAHKLNPHFAKLMEVMSLDNMVELLAGGKVDETTTNVNHARSLEGKAITVAGGYNQANFVMAEIRAQAEALGVDPSEVGVFYKYETASQGRSMMQGKYNPQSNKVVRNLVQPMKAVIDLTTEKGRFAWDMASLQMLGERTYEMNAQTITEKAAKIFSAPEVQEAIDVMQRVLEGNATGDDVVAAMKKAAPFLKDGTTPEAMHVLLDRARYYMTEDVTEFESRLYLEADGVANGPAGAMAMLTSYPDNQYVDYMAKAGLFIGNPEQVMYQHRAKDGDDLYTMAGTNTRAITSERLKSYGDTRNQKELKAQHTLTLQFLEAIFPAGDISYDEATGELSIKRGVTKNPLTVTVYGSGSQGIASKLLGLVETELAKRLSEAAKTGKFNTGSLDQKTFNSFFEWLSSTAPVYDSHGESDKKFYKVVRTNKAEPITKENYTSYRLTPAQRKALKDNIHHFFVKDLSKGIEQTVGTSVMQNSKNMILATGLQNVMVQHAFNKELEKIYEQKKKENPEWDKVLDGLSKKDFKQLEKNLSHLNIRLRTENQEWAVGETVKAVDGSTTISKSPFKGEEFAIPAVMNVPGSPGVQVVPYLVIGMGDAAMVQNLFTAEDRPKEMLQVFDGINIGLNDIDSGGPVINRSMVNAWLDNNPLRAVADSLQKALSLGNFDEAFSWFQEADPEAAKRYAGKGAQFADYNYDPETFLSVLQGEADRIDALHDAIKEVGFAADQMAATNTPYVLEGTTNTSNPLEASDTLNTAYTQRVVKEKFDTSADGAVMIKDQNSAKRFIRSKVTDPDLQALALKAITSAGPRLTLVVGDAADLVNAGVVGSVDLMNGLMAGTTQGFYDPETETVAMLKTASQETLVHELIHAATLQAMHAHANGAIHKGGMKDAVGNSIAILEGILEDLVTNGWDVSKYGDKAQRAYANMQATIRRELGISEDRTYADATVSQRMNALNEMMAWVLANRPLREMSALRSFKGAVQAIYGLIKRVLFGSEPAPALTRKVFDQINFHTQAVMGAQAKLFRAENQALMNQANDTLQHSTAYGDDARVAEIGKLFFDKVGQHLATRHSVMDQINAQIDAREATLFGLNTADAAQAAGFLKTPQQAAAFRKIVAALGSAAQINPLVLIEAQALFKEAVKNITVDSFVAPADKGNLTKEAIAQDKLNFLLGNAGVFKDKSGRSSLLPSFVALGLVDPDMRRVLDTVKPARARQGVEGTMDEKLTAVANNALSSLQDKLVNADRQPVTVERALDSLAETLKTESERNASLLDQIGQAVGGVVEKVNDMTIDALQSGSQKVSGTAKNVATRTKNKGVKAVAQTVEFAANVFTEQGAAVNAEASLRAINKTALPDWIKSVVKDLTGRTNTNAGIYDMVKQASQKVSKMRQLYKERLPKILQDKFSTPPTEDQWSHMYRGVAVTDLAALVRGSNFDAAFEVVTDQAKRKAEIAAIEQGVMAHKSREGKRILAKAKQLANYKITGEAGPALLMNADAVAHLVHDRASEFIANKVQKPADFVAQVDRLISLYSVDMLEKPVLQTMDQMIRSEPEALKQLVGVLRAQKERDAGRMTDAARFNALKGYIPSVGTNGGSLIVANDADIKELKAKGYERVGMYVGSKVFAGTSMGYYFAPISNKAPYNQGILQNARKSIGGVDAVTGHITGFPTAGRIVQKTTVKRLTKNFHLDTNKESLIPVFAADGTIVAFERSIDPAQLERLSPSTHLAAMIGQLVGRHAEEDLAEAVNQDAVARAYDMWKKDIGREDEYVNVLDPNAIKDVVTKEAISLMPKSVREEAERLFGANTFMVRKDTLEDLFGYRDASFSDFWTGNSRWSPESQKVVRDLLETVLGKDALGTVLNWEQKYKNVVKDAKTLIVVKSMVVPTVNMIANVFQLMASGIGPKTIAKGMRDKLVEVDFYVKSQVRKMDLEVELLAAVGDVARTNKLKAQIQTIEDSHKRLSVWPLIEAGEFGSISDVGISRDEILLSEGKLQAYLEAKTDKLPEGFKTLGKNILLTKDTALFQGFQKSMEYGDFLAKAIVYDHATKKKGMSKADALGWVTDEFVNYDRLPGRTRGALENFGMAWFYNYKLRIAKTAFRMIRQDPARVALLSALPVSFIETPVSENIFTKAVEGTLGYSLGPSMMFNSIGMNPVVNALTD